MFSCYDVGILSCCSQHGLVRGQVQWQHWHLPQVLCQGCVAEKSKDQLFTNFFLAVVFFVSFYSPYIIPAE